MPDILAIGAHPGEVERTCGGTLIKMAAAGYSTAIIDLTDGGMGTFGSPEQNVDQAEMAALVLRVGHRENLHFPDARLENTMPARMTLAQRIRDLAPRTVILPYWQSAHPDHVRASELAAEACFLAGLPRLDQYTPASRIEKILYASGLSDAAPSLATDISNEFETRMEALKRYSAGFNHQLRESLTLRARWFGAMIGVEYAEPFVIRGVVRADDLVTLPVGRPLSR
jgi:bacillithiol biosynthesis deacetylase BshB1